MKIWKIGSDIKNDLVVLDPAAEKHHAELQFDGTTIIVRDLNTKKGTWVNNWRVKQKVIEPTDKIMIGREWIDIDALLIKEPIVFEASNRVEEPKPKPIAALEAKQQESDEPQVVQLTPERKTFLENQQPKTWYHNYPLLWGAVVALFFWSAFLMYDHFSDMQEGLIISPQEKLKFDFLRENLKPRQVNISNASGKPFTILTITTITYDSTAKGWEFQKPVEQSLNLEIANGTYKPISVIKDAIMVSLFIRNEDTDFDFSRILTPQYPEFKKDKKGVEILEVKAPSRF